MRRAAVAWSPPLPLPPCHTPPPLLNVGGSAPQLAIQLRPHLFQRWPEMVPQLPVEASAAAAVPLVKAAVAVAAAAAVVVVVAAAPVAAVPAIAEKRAAGA